jgi:uncharacterized protein (DUF2249 family)
MILRILLFIIIATVLISNGHIIFNEPKRLKEQTEIDLNMTFAALPELLSNESFGNFEEGGDRALLRIADHDCTKLNTILEHTEPAEVSSEYLRMFKNEGFTPSVLKTKYWINQHGDSKHYVLDFASCVLYREAFFE